MLRAPGKTGGPTQLDLQLGAGWEALGKYATLLSLGYLFHKMGIIKYPAYKIVVLNEICVKLSRWLGTFNKCSLPLFLLSPLLISL